MVPATDRMGCQRTNRRPPSGGRTLNQGTTLIACDHRGRQSAVSCQMTDSHGAPQPSERGRRGARGAAARGAHDGTAVSSAREPGGPELVCVLSAFGRPLELAEQDPRALGLLRPHEEVGHLVVRARRDLLGDLAEGHHLVRPEVLRRLPQRLDARAAGDVVDQAVELPVEARDLPVGWIVRSRPYLKRPDSLAVAQC